MDTIRSYEDMENYVRKQIEGSRDFVDHDSWGFTMMRVGIQGKNEWHYASVHWYAGATAEERAVNKAVLEVESLYRITAEDAVSMIYSDEWEERDLAERFFIRFEENKDDFWEAEYMAAMDETETEENIKKLAADLWKQWKEYELDE